MFDLTCQQWIKIPTLKINAHNLKNNKTKQMKIWKKRKGKSTRSMMDYQRTTLRSNMQIHCSRFLLIKDAFVEDVLVNQLSVSNINEMSQFLYLSHPEQVVLNLENQSGRKSLSTRSDMKVEFSLLALLGKIQCLTSSWFLNEALLPLRHILMGLSVVCKHRQNSF